MAIDNVNDIVGGDEGGGVDGDGIPHSNKIIAFIGLVK